MKIPNDLTYYDQDAKEEVEIDVGTLERWLDVARNGTSEKKKENPIILR